MYNFYIRGRLTVNGLVCFNSIFLLCSTCCFQFLNFRMKRLYIQLSVSTKKIMFIYGLFKEFVTTKLYIYQEVYSENFWKYQVMRYAYRWIIIIIYIPGCLGVRADLSVCRKSGFVSEIITICPSVVIFFYLRTGCYYKYALWRGLTIKIKTLRN